MSEITELDLAKADVHACAYNACVNFGSERGRHKMWDLIRSINREMRLDGKAKMDELVDLGIIDSYTECSSECCMRPGGLFHVDGCQNESNTDFIRGIWERTREQLPEPKRARYTSIGLVGGSRDRRIDMVLPYVQAHRHADPIGNPITCAEAGCEGEPG